MLLNIIWMIAGIALVLWGADRLTDGAVAIAERMHISQMVIGLTIVAMGTSMPEFFCEFHVGFERYARHGSGQCCRF